MRHWLILFVLLLAAYGLWHVAGRRGMQRVGQHLLRIAAIALALLGLLVVAYHSHALKLL